ncbi:MAG: precorrin-4 C(11)-methyltransferase [Peptococcaceae bacterium]|nr:precorrin-4 C(11)-methyltransferase [Peptococcaceae bacterium]
MIHFVGAGPGAVDLITVRGKSLLEKADLIIYAGSLVNPELLKAAKPDCQILNSAVLTLEQVIAAMVEAAKQGQTIVRLHTGDPSLYGAIREQMDLLDAYGLEYEVVPGVSSFCAAAAALKAEYTLPDVSQSVIITRMEGRTPVPPQEEISLLASHKATMVVFLSAGMLDKLTERLLAGGYSENTPAAIVYKASWDDQQVFRCSVATLAKTAKDHDIQKTALILIGGFLGSGYQRSKLYDPAFTHEFRDGHGGPNAAMPRMARSGDGHGGPNTAMPRMARSGDGNRQ